MPRSISHAASGLSIARLAGSCHSAALAPATEKLRRSIQACHSVSRSNAGMAGSTVQPSARKCSSARAQVSSNPGSVGSWPFILPSQPMRTPLQSRSGGNTKLPGGSQRRVSGRRASKPACTDSSRARSGTLRAIGPATLNCWKKTSSVGPCGTRPNEVRNP